MSELQYELEIQSNTLVKESGSFFYAAPFTVFISGKQFDVTFEKGTDGHVRRRVLEGAKLLCELGHPDYTPACTVDQLNDHLGFSEALTLFAAFAHVKVIFEKDYLKAYAENSLPVSDYSLKQDRFL